MKAPLHAHNRATTAAGRESSVITAQALGDELRHCANVARAPLVRSMREFAEDEIIIPDGPFAGRRFRCERQPWSRLWFDAIDSHRWNRAVATGPTQSGKSTIAFQIPILYSLFELKETVIVGIPDLEMAADKWRETLLPVIAKSRFRDQLPMRGDASRGGKRMIAIKFRNGATMRFMSSTGSDKRRAAFTGRVVVITEVDGMDESSTTSREADPVTQIEARRRAYGSRGMSFLECTVSTNEGRIWQELQSGTHTRIALRCPHCHEFVTPEREHFKGWEGTPSAADAMRHASFYCPKCAKAWSDADRRLANQSPVAVHEGQEIVTDPAAPGGFRIDGPEPDCTTFSMRWSAVNNLFLSSADIAHDEWRAAHREDEDAAQREILQFVWCIPYQTSEEGTGIPDAQAIQRRVSGLPRGIAPADTRALTVGVDLGRYLGHYVATAWRPDGAGCIVDYGRFEIPSDSLGEERAILVGLRELRDIFASGYGLESGGTVQPAQVWIDAGYMGEIVHQFARESGPKLFRAVVGRGASQQHGASYTRPKTTGAMVVYIGDEYHVARLRRPPRMLVEVNADHWKTRVHARLNASPGNSNALTVFDAPEKEHTSFAKHLTAEARYEEFIPGRGVVTKWKRVRRSNHWFDALYLSCAAGHFAGIRGYTVELPPAAVRAAHSRSPIRPDGQPFLITQRK